MCFCLGRSFIGAYVQHDGLNTVSLLVLSRVSSAVCAPPNTGGPTPRSDAGRTRMLTRGRCLPATPLEIMQPYL